MTPGVDIVVPTFNRANLLPECLDSLLAQNLKPARIIVVNDGSTDDTVQVLRRYEPLVRHVTTPNAGRAAAINVGLSQVKADYVWIFDDDDVALPDGLERMVLPLVPRPDCGYSYSSFYITDSDPETGRIGKVRCEFKLPDVETRGALPPLLEANYLCGAGLLARTACYAKVGLFDPQLVRAQDYEMAIRLARAFAGIRAPGGATFHYRQHEGVRGSLRDSFPAHERGERWRHYDRIFFRRLYQELPLDEYLPPGRVLAQEMRLALMQRLAAMASKRLAGEVVLDLHLLARLDNVTPWSALEQYLIREQLYRQFIRKYEEPQVLATIRELSHGSPVIRRIRARLVRDAVAYCRYRLSRAEVQRCGRLLLRLYLPGFSKAGFFHCNGDENMGF